MLDSPAFPLAVLDQGDSGNLLLVEHCRGMTMFDYFSGQALAGLAAHPDAMRIDPLAIAGRAMMLADAMLKASNHWPDSLRGKDVHPTLESDED